MEYNIYTSYNKIKHIKERDDLAEIFLIIMGIGYLIYKVAFEVPKDIKRLENKMDKIDLQLQEILFRLNKLD